MRVAMVSEHASPLAAVGGVDAGGQNVHVAALALGLARLGADVVVHTRRDDPSLPRRVPLTPVGGVGTRRPRGSVVVDHVPAGPPAAVSKDGLLPYMDGFAADLQAQWLVDTPDVVHAHFWMSGRAALAAAEPLAIPVAHTFHALGVVKRRHQGLNDTSPPQRLVEERAIIHRADRVIATCTDEVTELARLHADLCRVSVIPCGVDLRRFRPDGPVEPRSSGRHRLLVLGRLVERKGVGDVVSALADLPDTELVIAGGPDALELASDPEAQRLAVLAERHGVADRIVWRGRVARAEVPALMRSADVVVCAPWYEPFGIVPVEAMACGVPVVATAVGGMLDTIVDGVTGVHVPPHDPDALAAALGDLLAQPLRLAEMGAAGVHRARSCYSWDRVARLTLQTYRELAAGEAVGTVAVGSEAGVGR
jgi:D-inositol-3-phosphate glycosyltransferase